VNPLNEGRRALLTGGCCRRTIEGYVIASLNDSNKERKTSQLPTQLCCTTERREEVGAGLFPEAGGQLIIAGTGPLISGGGGRAWSLHWERATKALDGTGAQRPCRWELPGGL